MNGQYQGMQAKHARPLVRVINADLNFADGWQDLADGFLRHELWLNFAWHDIRQRFRRSVLGPFWITLSMGILVGALGMVFGGIFKQDIGTFLPYLAIGLIFWGLLTAAINEGATVFISAEGFIRDVPMPISAHFYRLMARNLIIWGHNMAIYLFVFIVFMRFVNLNFLWFFPGFLLFVLNTAWITLVVGILSTRFRDIPQVIANVLQVVFFITPIFWSLDSFPDRPAFITWNPIYHLIEIVRAPLLGEVAPIESWIVAGVLCIVGMSVAAWLYGRAHSRIPFWV